MSDGHFRSLQPRIGRSLYEKSASNKVLILEKSRVKIPLVIGGPLRAYPNFRSLHSRMDFLAVSDYGIRPYMLL